MQLMLAQYGLSSRQYCKSGIQTLHRLFTVNHPELSMQRQLATIVRRRSTLTRMCCTCPPKLSHYAP
jgi:hypothetical protein